jgi:hypothetical protein
METLEGPYLTHAIWHGLKAGDLISMYYSGSSYTTRVTCVQGPKIFFLDPFVWRAEELLLRFMRWGSVVALAIWLYAWAYHLLG